MRFRRYLPWLAAAVLFAWVAHGPIRPSAGEADVEGARRAVRELTAALAAGNLDRLAALYEPDADHRDLRRGRRVRGRTAIRAFLDEGYGEGPGGDAEVASLRLLGPGVAIAQLTLEPAAASGWPPYLTALLRCRGGRWRVGATRSGGNPDTRAHGLRSDPPGGPAARESRSP